MRVETRQGMTAERDTVDMMRIYPGSVWRLAERSGHV